MGRKGGQRQEKSQGGHGGPSGSRGGPRGGRGGPPGSHEGLQVTRGGPQDDLGGPQGDLGGPQGDLGGPQGGGGGPWGGRGGPPDIRGGSPAGRGGPRGGRGEPQIIRGGPPGGRGEPPGGRGEPPGGRGGPPGGRGGPPGGRGGPPGGRGGPPGGLGGPPGGREGPQVTRGGPQGDLGGPQGGGGGPWGGRGGPPDIRGGSPAGRGGPQGGRGEPQIIRGGPPGGLGGPPGGLGGPPGGLGGPPGGRGGPPGGRGGPPGGRGGPPGGHGGPQSGYGQPPNPPIGRGAPRAGQGETSLIGSGAPLPGQGGLPPYDREAPSAGGQGATTEQGPLHVQKGSQFGTMESPSITSTSRSSGAKLPSKLTQELIMSIPTRKDPLKAGTLGRPITVETNMFSINLNENFRTHVVHYDVDIVPNLPKFLMRPAFEAFRENNCPKRYPAFDGKKNAYSAGDLLDEDIVEDEVEVFDADRQQKRTFRVTIKKVNELDLSWLQNVRPGLMESERHQAGLQALDIILRQNPSTHSIVVGRSFFQQPKTEMSLSAGLSLWVGAFQSAVLGWKPYLNVDVAHKGVPTPQNVIELMKELCKNPKDRNPPSNITPYDVKRNANHIEKYLKGLKVLYEIPGNPNSKRTHRVNSLGESPLTNRFKLDNGQECTVLDYYLKEKGYSIKFPDIPCLWVGSMNKKIYVPPELCEIVPGQMRQKKLNEQQTSNMIRYAATDTHTRKQKIMDKFAALCINEGPTMKEEFQLSVEGHFTQVPARVLNPPALLYNTPKGQNERPSRVAKGVWRAQTFLTPASLLDDTWSILNLNENFVKDRDMYDLQNALLSGATDVGMSIGKPYTPFVSLPQPFRNISNIIDYFEKMKRGGLKLIIVIIPDRVEVYSKVKQITELKIGLLTQCLKTATLRKLSPATIGNILQKINSKLNGVNHTFSSTTRPICLSKPCMIVGADVTHPSPDSQNTPSIAAVAASHDSQAFQYNCEIRLQPPRMEIIQDLTEIMVKQLKYFYARTRCQPARIIFYRDGVSEGDLPRVMHYEISALRAAFRKLSPSGQYNPALTFLVVQKRHHVRLFPTSKQNSDDRNYNVQAGTIVDTHITHPSHIDFYLLSHASIQGTARPTKYRCICNETNDSEDDIEQLTYYLCHMFSRCTRSVSYPAPTYYAHLAAFRARALIYGVEINLDDLPHEQEEKLSLVISRDAPMFFV